MSDDAAFRAEIRAFIKDNLPSDVAERTLKGYHPHKPDIQVWTRALHQRGWSVPNWPVEYGGPGWTVTQRHIFEEECFLAGAPVLSPQGVNLVGPIIYTYGNDAQKAQHLEPIRSGEILWGQGFSEPNAGSDLASLTTKAVRDGDDFIVNGQKIWTSEVHFAEWLFLLVRTAFEGRPQAGISFLLVDMNTPGIVVRPIIGIENGHSLNEVFLTDVRVPAANLIGQENMGWTYAKELLATERTFSAEVPRCKGVLERARMIARETKVRGKPLIEDPHFARRLAQLEIELIAHATTLERCIAEEEANVHAAVGTSSILKVRGTELMQKIGSLAIEALGDNALPEYPEHDYFMNPPPNHAGSSLAIGVVSDALYRRAMTIYGGSNEVQRNIIAAQLLRA